jgi:2-polyprenyl-6-hydroxyphenyl methylase/3-demethylubiquinone-9 3-methyltransferase
MWQAMENAINLINSKGLFWFSIYVKGENYQRDLKLKVKYNRASFFGKKNIELRWILRLMRQMLNERKNPFKWNIKKKRGMSTYYDLVDWLGGLPYEVASKNEVIDFCKERGLEPIKILEVPEGCCNVYLFRKK